MKTGFIVLCGPAARIGYLTPLVSPVTGFARPSSFTSLCQTPNARCLSCGCLCGADFSLSWSTEVDPTKCIQCKYSSGLGWQGVLQSEVKEEALAARSVPGDTSGAGHPAAPSPPQLLTALTPGYLCTPNFSRQPGNSLSASPGNDSNARANSLCSLANSIGSAPAFQHSYDWRREMAPAAGESMWP